MSVQIANQAPKGFDPNTAGNLEDMEKQFAVRAVQQMSTYWSLLEKMPGSSLRLTKLDEEIVAHLEADFPDFDPAEPIDEDAMKSKEGKERWRTFMNQYENKVRDFNFGTILRRGPKMEYGEDETIFVPRMQFYAVEILRNRRGLNDWIYEREEASKKAATTEAAS